MKYLFITILTVFFEFNSISQPLYVQANLGYGFAFAPRTVNMEEVTNNYASTNTYTYKVGKLQSLGKGLHFGATIGYYLNTHASLELGLDYTMGNNLTNTVINNYNYTGQPVSKDIITTTIYANMLRIMPGLRISTGSKNLKPYLKAGLSIGIVTDYKRSHDVSAGNGTITTSEEKVRKGPAAIGFYGGLGFSYNITKRISIFGEGLLISQTWAASSEKLIKSSSNGVEKDLSKMNTINVETVFLDEVNKDGTTDVNKPLENIKEYLPFSSVGINLGLAFTFSKSEKKPKK